MNCKIEELKCISNRLCGLKLLINEFEILIINVYMPCDPGLMEGNLNEYNDVLAELNQIILCSCSQHVIIGGDFNTDMGRNNAQTKAFQ